MTPAHLHLLLNHVPVVGIPLAALLLFIAWVRGSRELQSVALGCAFLISLSAIPAFVTGEPAEKQIEHAPGVTEEHIHAHEDMARIALGLSLLSAIVTGIALVRGRSRGPSRGWVGISLLLALLASAVLAVTADRGGHIRHPELDPGGLGISENADRG